MNTRRLWIVFLACSTVGTVVMAQQTSPTRTRQVAPEPAQSEPARPDPGSRPPPRAVAAPAAGIPTVPVDSVAEDLQKIVVLCATEPASEAFRGEWLRYIETHRVTADRLDALIDDVIGRAEAYRLGLSSAQPAGRARQDVATTRKAMHDSAMNSIRNMR